MKAPSTSTIRGPFVVQQQGPDEPIYILDIANRFVARIEKDLPPAYRMEHAQLLAAAPELLAELKRLCDMLEGADHPLPRARSLINRFYRNGGPRS